ncbi:Hypothetical predicted protein [Podarcis lilfordi]|uniref:Secreted protein n=1 Tax=Podarcis lilfordi TaxID=74358 RepID=A0AA35NXV8_9SAUR|nr:Hypothetical predicted protein [Podarcis lilfordi]
MQFVYGPLLPLLLALPDKCLPSGIPGERSCWSRSREGAQRQKRRRRSAKHLLNGRIFIALELLKVTSLSGPLSGFKKKRKPHQIGLFLVFGRRGGGGKPSEDFQNIPSSLSLCSPSQAIMDFLWMS